MTEAGKKWAVEIYPGDLRRKSIPDMAEFWLRAFCEEVEKQAELKAALGRNSPFPFYTDAFDEVKRKLLGEK